MSPPFVARPPLRRSSDVPRLSSRTKNISLPKSSRGSSFLPPPLSSVSSLFITLNCLLPSPLALPLVLLQLRSDGPPRAASFFFPGAIFLARFLMESLFLMDSAKSILPQFLLSSAGEKEKKSLFLSLSLFHHLSFPIAHVRISPLTRIINERSQ